MEETIMENLDQPTALDGNPANATTPYINKLYEYSVNIRFLTVGCMVEIGCKTIAFESKQKMLEELTAYVNSTKETVIKWQKIFKEAENESI